MIKYSILPKAGMVGDWGCTLSITAKCDLCREVKKLSTFVEDGELIICDECAESFLDDRREPLDEGKTPSSKKRVHKKGICPSCNKGPRRIAYIDPETGEYICQTCYLNKIGKIPKKKVGVCPLCTRGPKQIVYVDSDTGKNICETCSQKKTGGRCEIEKWVCAFLVIKGPGGSLILSRKLVRIFAKHVILRKREKK